MTIEHSVIVDPDIHEPKGVASALSGQVYVADGAGSGSWGSVSGTATNLVYVSTISDFPSAVSGVITLADNTIYVLTEDISTSNRFVAGDSNLITAFTYNGPKLTYTGSGNMFTVTDVNFSMRLIRLDCASGTVFSVTDNTGGAIIFDLNGVIVENCAKYGNVINTQSVLIDNCSCLNATDGLSLSGANFLLLSIDKFGVIGTGGASFTGIDLGTSVIQFPFIDRLQILSTVSGATGISGLASGGNIASGQIGRLVECSFDGLITALSNILNTDEEWEIWHCQGVGDTVTQGTGYISSSALNTTFGATSTPVKANFGTAFIASTQDRVSVDNTGRFTFNALSGERLTVTAEIFATIAGGAARQYNYYIAKNGTIIPSSISRAEYDGSNPGSNSVSVSVDMSAGDYLELWVEAITATTNLNINTCSITAAR